LARDLSVLSFFQIHFFFFLEHFQVHRRTEQEGGGKRERKGRERKRKREREREKERERERLSW
jgi:hypothetical protein